MERAAVVPLRRPGSWRPRRPLLAEPVHVDSRLLCFDCLGGRRAGLCRPPPRSRFDVGSILLVSRLGLDRGYPCRRPHRLLRRPAFWFASLLQLLPSPSLAVSLVVIWRELDFGVVQFELLDQGPVAGDALCAQGFVIARVWRRSVPSHDVAVEKELRLLTKRSGRGTRPEARSATSVTRRDLCEFTRLQQSTTSQCQRLALVSIDECCRAVDEDEKGIAG